MRNHFASCCVLSYERPDFLRESIRSMVAYAEYPIEIIVHDDGSRDPEVRKLLTHLLDTGLISAAILNAPGHNQGQGVAVNRMFQLAKGDYLLKLDQDLMYKPGWLRRAVGILDQNWERSPDSIPRIGAMGLFRYPAEPVRYEDMFMQKFGSEEFAWEQHKDFVSSALLIPRGIWDRFGPWVERSVEFAEDVAFKEAITGSGEYVLALPATDDYCQNVGFGEGPSTVVVRDENGQLASRVIKTGPALIEPIKPPVPAMPEPQKDGPNIGVVIPVGPGRAENLAMVIDCLNKQTTLPEAVALVCDGPEAHLQLEPKEDFKLSVAVIHAPKHEPGMEQPRNVGVRELEKLGCTHVWFMDTDVIVGEDALGHLYRSIAACEKAGDPADVICAPYEWMPPGMREPMPMLKNDPRWPHFDGKREDEVTRGDMGCGLACFSGNLVWEIEAFKRSGGFWNELHHGRCEDGELGLRAVAMNMGIAFCAKARGWHLYHDFNEEVVRERNARDVPMLDARHPWVKDEGVFVADEDGKRFDVKCVCGWEGPTSQIFQHQSECLAEKI